MDWDFDLLEAWDLKITELAKEKGLDWFPITYEVCDYYSMIGHMSYHGMPTHYGHWSYGKSFERTHTMYNMGAEGLPYELIINSNPSIAYLMRENPAYLQILIMAHCVGHSDFFKNNRMFKGTRPNSIVGKMRSAKKRIQSYVEDPTIGIEEVEKVLDAAQALQFQTYRYGQTRKTREELEAKYTKLIKEDSTGDYDFFNMTKNPLEPDYDILGFVIANGKNIPSWKKDIIQIVMEESKYFIPQIQTKIMNEGWASYWHYTLCNELNLPQKWHIPFIKMHNQVIRPHIGGLNPYHLGFVIFQDIKEKHGIDECFVARECSHDVAFIRQYLTRELCEDLGLFSFSEKKTKGLTIDEIYDEDGWETIRETLIKNIGTNGIPVIYVDEVEDDNTLILRHEHDGRDLELNHADEVLCHIKTLWEDEAKLFTVIEEELWEI
jgi:stage V sporulation protein R